MSRTPAPRMLVFGSAVGLFILPAVWSGLANACVIFVRSPVSVGAVGGQCTADATEENAPRDGDRNVLSDDNLAASGPSGLILWSLFGDRPEVVAVNIEVSRRSRPTVSSDRAGALDAAASPERDPGSGPLRTWHTAADLNLAFASREIRPASDRAGLPDDVLWQAVRSVAQYYDVMNPDGDFAAVIRVAVEAIHTISSDLEAVATATGLGAANRYQGDTADTGLLDTNASRTVHEIGSVAYYLAEMQRFVFSRDGLITGLIIMVVYIAISGLYSLLRSLR